MIRRVRVFRRVYMAGEARKNITRESSFGDVESVGKTGEIVDIQAGDSKFLSSPSCSS